MTSDQTSLAHDHTQSLRTSPTDQPSSKIYYGWWVVLRETAFAGAFLVGLGLGAEVDLIPYLASRYFGLRDFGKVYSSLFAAFALAGAVRPLIMGAGFDRTGSYSRPLVGFFVAILLATVLMTRLGPYRFRPRESKDDCLKHKVAEELRVQREDQCL